MAKLTRSLTMNVQQHSCWCWAAVAESVDAYCGGTATQCHIANLVRKRPDCCNKKCPPKCDQPDSLQNALTRVKRLAFTQLGAATGSQLNTELKNDRPVGVQIRLMGGAAHFLLISEHTSGTVTYHDPNHGRSVALGLAALARSAHGSWGETYFTT